MRKEQRRGHLNEKHGAIEPAPRTAAWSRRPGGRVRAPPRGLGQRRDASPSRGFSDSSETR